MQYLLTPLHLHFDSGFGGTASAFRRAAKQITRKATVRPGIDLAHLPANYLRRHAIELYLKSAIVILHRRLRIPYGTRPPDAEPYFLAGTRWKPFQQGHSVLELWEYLTHLVDAHRDALEEIAPHCWSFPPEAAAWVAEIDRLDPRSTFFRYPDTKNPARDAPKAGMKAGTPAEIEQRMRESPAGAPGQFVLLMDDETTGEVVESYYYDGEPLASLSAALRDALELLYGLHAVMRTELCGGW